jgi:agmatinase
MSQQSAFEYLRHGQTPFFRLPLAELSRGRDAYEGAGAVLLGVPYDGGVTYQPGARMAPYHLRRVSALVQTVHPVHRIDVFRSVAAVDGGNVAFPPFDRAAMRSLVHDEVAAILDAGAVPLVIGGDHTVALPALRAAAARHGPLAVVHVDAHLDTSGPEVWGDAYHHGTPLRHALAEGLIAPGQLFQVGIRGAWGHPEEDAFSRAHGARIFSMDEVVCRGVAAVAADIRERVGDRPVYLTYDIDAVDPAYAPGTGTPVPGGLSAREALQFLRELGGVELVGMDLVEVAPALDHADMTANLGAYLLFEGLALVALARAGKVSVPARG